MSEPIQPIVPEGTPLPTPPVGVPPFPITPFSVWTWSTPVIPNFYWNIYSAEQRIKAICKEIGKIEAYLQYLVTKTNENIIEIHQRIDQLTDRVAQLERHVEEEVARLDALIAQLRADLEQEIADREAADAALGERIDQEILDRTHGDQTLHQEIADEATARTHADDQLHGEISTETQNRIHADDALGARIDAEAQSRAAADASLHAEIADEATARAHGDEALHTEISTETQARIHADTALEEKLEAELQAEADMRQEEDQSLRSAISTEETERKAADASLGQRITQETSDREAADSVLDTKIATEAHDREAGDDQLASDLEAEVAAREAGDATLRSALTTEEGAREAADQALETKIAKRLLPSEVLAGDEISITKDPNSNEITISSTVAHSISNLETLITSLQAALTAETAERRADDSSLWKAVNERIERGKILAGAGIKVENDPDESTVTISATSTIEGGDGIKVETEGDKSTISLANPYPSVKGTAPVEVTGTPAEGYTISVSEATEGRAGVISEARVKSMAGIFPGDGINVSGRFISLKTSGNSSTVRQSSRKTLIAPIISDKGVNIDIELGPITRVENRNDAKFAASGLEFSTTIAGSTSYGVGVGLGVAAGQGLEIGEDDGRLKAKTATEEEAGIISEARVKELAGETAPSLSAKSPLKLEDGELSAIPYPSVEGEGPVTVESRSASRPGAETGMTYSVGVSTATENEAGVISEARVKEIVAEAIAAALAKDSTEPSE